ncbi:MAG: UbiD family decarboxylase [Deltaproteobacteria bacterium]|nr:UbiD family decarboxylase [Deltaproteobacteria bacterium]
MRDLQAYVGALEKKGLLARIQTEVDPVHELAGVARHFEGKEVVLFEKIRGHDMPVLIGLMWNRKNVGALFDVPPQKLPFHIGEAMAKWKSAPSDPALLPVMVNDAPAQQSRLEPVDLAGLPSPVLALEDGGPYLSNSVVIAKDPDTGVRNTSIHRAMITGPRRMTFLMDKGRHLRDYYERAEKRGQPLEITISNGVNVPSAIASVTPSSVASMDSDELGIASALLGEPVRLSKSLTVAPEGLADAQYIIEGELLPAVREPEGPFAEVSGYYAARDNRWVVDVKAITRRENPIVHTLLPGAEVYNYVGLTAEAAVFRSISTQMGGVRNVHLAHSGGGFYTAVVEMEPQAPGFAKQAIAAAFAAFPPLQIVTVVNSDIDIFNADDVQWAMATRFDPGTDLVIMKNCYGHELNPQVKNGLVTKIGFDCTCPVPRPESFKRVAFKEVDLGKYSVRIERR